MNTSIFNFKRSFLLAAAICNSVVVLLELGAVASDFLTHNTQAFVYYTNDSNYLSCIVCFLCALFEFKSVRRGTQVPYVIKVLKFVSTCCLMLTFTVVVTILVPAWNSTGVNGFVKMFGSYQMFVRHFLCPAVTFASFVFLEKDFSFSKGAIFYGELPTVLYAGITIVLNALYVIDGPYPFLRVHNQSVAMSFVWGIAIIGLSLFLSWLVWFCNRHLLLTMKR